MPTKPWFYECRTCGNFHPWAFEGDCRENQERLTLGFLWAKYGMDGFHYTTAGEREEARAGGNLDEDPQRWLKAQFEFEWCPECGRDHRHHTAVPVMGNWLARCDREPVLAADELIVNPENYAEQGWSVATNGAVKGYFLDRAGEAYRKSNGAIIAFKSREAAQRKANSLNRWQPGNELTEAALSAYRNRKAWGG